MTALAIRSGWKPFESGWYHSTDGRFSIFVVGWDETPASRLYHADGSPYGYDLFEGDEKLGRYPSVDAAVAGARDVKKRRKISI